MNLVNDISLARNPAAMVSIKLQAEKKMATRKAEYDVALGDDIVVSQSRPRTSTDSELKAAAALKPGFCSARPSRSHNLPGLLPKAQAV